MNIKKSHLRRILLVIPVIIILLFTGFLTGSIYSDKVLTVLKNDMLLSGLAGKVTGATPIPTQIAPTPTMIPPTPTPIDYKISVIDSPSELLEGTRATFTWTIDGLPKTIHKSTVYFGLESTGGTVTKETAPAETKYTMAVKDFLAGDFAIPMRFIGNAEITKQGKYFFRAYASIDGKNYWSGEGELTVKPPPAPSYGIKLVNYPQKVKLNDNSAFTWEISGPQTTIGFTAIVGAKEAKSGHLEETVDISKTPYKILVKDFTSGSYSIPLTYVGNTVMPEYGIYFIRALAVVNGKNLWSDEYTLTVQ